MNPFHFETTPRIICHTGAITKLGEVARNLGIRHAFFVTDKGLHQAGLTSAAMDSLKAADIAVTVFSEVQADPPESVIVQAAAAASEAGADGVIGFGGGSSMDTAKLVALLVRSPQELSAIYGAGLARGPRLPLIQIPTTAGTGSEVTPISVVTTPTEEKKAVFSSLLLPDIALLDAQLTIALPPAVTGATGVDALVHAIESLSTRLKRNPLSDLLAIKAVQMICDNLPKAVKEGGNLEVREQMLLASLFAGMAFANASVGAVHAFAYPLGVRFHVPHGLSNSLMLPHILRFNLRAAESTYAMLGRSIRPELETASDAAASEAFVDAMSELVAQMPYAQSLRELGVARDDLALLAQEVMGIQRLLVHNPRPITHEDAMNLYAQAF
ncbi:iron-containing alcohol dehydrogenase [Comamonas sp. Tr-654]|uniref:iron-containing alcohol dehydrogenase n=1 Tax=Comamonas sp. Tr-654 TaxID=2608341 RepID=UPI00141F2C26|nr:iron-containing alcohol dehydrogenase [Comamonas sp. Tr-654]NIF85817.1 iron-containing alcohol dehydrogenase [Comamonas sp. Tr-654]